MAKSTKNDSEYNRKRNFDMTSEPREDHAAREKKPSGQKRTNALRFVVQKHAARRLHYDFRLELDGTLKSWAVPKGPSLDPKDKRLAVHVEDHPMAYASFEGSIPAGQYGAGDVIVWDQGVWRSLDEDPTAAYAAGKLKFTLIGEKLSGDWNLVRTTMRASGDKEQWLLIKERDQAARRAEDYNIVKEEPDSVLSSANIPGKPAGKSSASANKSASRSASKHTSSHNVRPIKAGQSLPEHLAPELATLVSEPLTGKWLYEVKFDGYRILARILDGDVRLSTRNDNDWTRRMPKQVQAIKELGLDNSWLDGEVVVLNDEGLPDFQALQRAFEIGRSHNIVYYVFDAPFLNGSDMRRLPVEERRAALESVLPGNNKGLVRFSTAFEDGHASILETACAMSLEGIIGKRLGSPYVSRRSADWIKLKCRLRQEFVIVGYTPPQGSRSHFGALLLGVHKAVNDPELIYAGRVGTGFNATSLKDIHRQLHPLERTDSSLSHSISSSEARDVHWLEPTLVCEVEFAEWTGDNRLRQASFIALRSDKPAREIIREQPRTPGDVAGVRSNAATKKRQTAKAKAGPHNDQDKPTKSNRKDSSTLAGVKITHPERELDNESQTCKLDLAHFYDDISEWILPHLDNRPVSLLRLPTGLDGEQFFQKHSEHLAIPAVKQLDAALDPGHARLMEIDSTAALVGAVQMGTIEFHTWGSTSDRIEKPDRIILDLDPDPALPWKSMLDATRLTLAVLDELGLETFLKTSGGKGIHLIIPLARRDDWITIKEFAKAIAQFMARQLPDRFVARMGPKNRVGTIFVDYLRNQRGASTVAAYSVRARPGLPVSVPIARDELTHLHSAAQWHIGNLRRRLAALKSDPWADYANQQRITRAMWKRLGVSPPE